MSLHFKWLSDSVAAAGQISPDEVSAIAAHGFKTIINNRPDGEGGPGQPASHDIAHAAGVAGIQYFHVPVVSGALTVDQVEQTRQILHSAPRPAFLFCRSGARSEHLYVLAGGDDA
jgi:uncharacterized protein (TIGR01244 family)